jgi:hypothetical protein
MQDDVPIATRRLCAADQVCKSADGLQATRQDCQSSEQQAKSSV